MYMRIYIYIYIYIYMRFRSLLASRIAVVDISCDEGIDLLKYASDIHT